MSSKTFRDKFVYGEEGPRYWRARIKFPSGARFHGPKFETEREADEYAERMNRELAAQGLPDRALSAAEKQKLAQDLYVEGSRTQLVIASSPRGPIDAETGAWLDEQRARAEADQLTAEQIARTALPLVAPHGWWPPIFAKGVT